MLNQQREELEALREETEIKLQSKKDNLHDHEKIIQQLLAFDVPSRVVLAQLIERITIYEHDNRKKEVKIQYTFPNPFDE
jgi:hypothetical protein